MPYIYATIFLNSLSVKQDGTCKDLVFACVCKCVCVSLCVSVFVVSGSQMAQGLAGAVAGSELR